MTYKKIFVPLIILAFVILYFAPDIAFARAGGGGSIGVEKGIMFYILFPFLMIYAAIFIFRLQKKNKENKKIIEQLSKQDRSWNMSKIKATIEVTFFKVQEAWVEQDQEIAKNYISERLYTKHKIQTDQQTKNKRKNILEDINLKSAQIVQVLDFNDDSMDRIVVFVHGTMIDYTIDTDTEELVYGNKTGHNSFMELWTFIKDENDKWVLDEINQDANLSEINSLVTYVEKPNQCINTDGKDVCGLRV